MWVIVKERLMKKVLFTISLVVFGSITTVASYAENDSVELREQNDLSQEDVNVQKEVQSEKLVSPSKKTIPNYTLTFDNINELSKSEALSDKLKKLLVSSLKLIRGLLNNDGAMGNEDDLQSAEGYLSQYRTLGDRLKDTESVEKIYKVPELSVSGKNEIEKNRKIIELLPKANSLQKIMDLPNLNKDTLERLKAYNNILASIENVKELSDVYKIPGIPPEFVEESKKNQELFEEMKRIRDIESLKKFPMVDPELIEEIQKLEQLAVYIRENTDSIEGTKKIPGLSEKTIVAISRLETENESLREENAKLSRNLKKLSEDFDHASQLTRNEYYFRMIVISLLERALFGFEFALADNFDNLSSDYEHSIVAHATKLLPWSAGLNKDIWCRVAEIIGAMLQLALSVDDISDHISWLEKNVRHALSNLKKCNDEKTRFVIEALERLSNSLEKYKRNKNSAEFDDFNERKKVILERLERLSNNHKVEEINSEKGKIKEQKASKEKSSQPESKEKEKAEAKQPEPKEKEKAEAKQPESKEKEKAEAKQPEPKKKTKAPKAENKEAKAK